MAPRMWSAAASSSARGNTHPELDERWSEPTTLQTDRCLSYISQLTRSPEIDKTQLVLGFNKFPRTHSHLNGVRRVRDGKPGLLISGFTIPVYTAPNTSQDDRYFRCETLPNISKIMSEDSRLTQMQREAFKSTYRECQDDPYARYVHYLVVNRNGAVVRHDLQCQPPSCSGYLDFNPDPEEEDDTEQYDTVQYDTEQGEYKCNRATDQAVFDVTAMSDNQMASILKQDREKIKDLMVVNPVIGHSRAKKSVYMYNTDISTADGEVQAIHQISAKDFHPLIVTDDLSNW